MSVSVCLCVAEEVEGGEGNTVCLVAQLCLPLYDSMDCSPPDSSVQGDSPGKNTGVGCHALLQGIFPTWGSNPGLPNCRPNNFGWSLEEGTDPGPPICLLCGPRLVCIREDLPPPLSFQHFNLSVCITNCCSQSISWGLFLLFQLYSEFTRGGSPPCTADKRAPTVKIPVVMGRRLGPYLG